MKYIKEPVRVRIAPSPTGPLHIGVTRVALFNYLFAKKFKGVFVLRIEDTDLERSNPKWEKDIMEGLKWLRIEWDEGPRSRTFGSLRGRSEILNYRKKYIGGYGPYRQSERLLSYNKYLEKLLKEDKAYYCFCSEEELETYRQYQMSIGQPPRYSGKCLGLSKAEVKKYLAQGQPSIIRFKVPVKKVVFNDLIRGRLEFDSSLIGDFAIAKNFSPLNNRRANLTGCTPLNNFAEGEIAAKRHLTGRATPLYNFAVVIDDFEMKISHVIRGEDHISNTPKQILLQEALGFPQPEYAHLPLILGPDRSKLSKRHGAVAINQYRKEGYLPETLINFMALLGWNPGTEQEIFSMNSLIKKFSLERVQKGGAIFNIKKMESLNGFYIRQKSLNKLTELCLPYLIEEGLIVPAFKTEQYPPAYGGIEIAQIFKIPETGEEINFDYFKKIVGLYQERLKKLSEISELVDFFFKKELKYDKGLLRWKEMDDREVAQSLDKLEEILSKIKERDWTKEGLEKTIMPEAEKMGPVPQQAGYGVKNRGYLLWPFRAALSGKRASAGPFEIAESLEKEKTLRRIGEAKKIVGKN